MENTTMASVRVHASLPDQLSEFVKRQVKVGGFTNDADYVRHVIRKEMRRTKEEQIAWINDELDRSMKSGISDATPAQIKKRIDQTIKKAQAER